MPRLILSVLELRFDELANLEQFLAKNACTCGLFRNVLLRRVLHLFKAVFYRSKNHLQERVLVIVIPT
jgi:hypothetical protein